jgi:hypothetical protein
MTRRAEAGAAERAALLATKLHLPSSRPGQVPRPRLAQCLDEGLARGLVLVCAPAGYGKTALLADWAQHRPSRTAWLSLDSGDNDPARFWRHAVAAMDQVRPGLDQRLGPMLGPTAAASYEPLVTALINELAADSPGDPLVLILDDYHAIESPVVHGSIGFLLEHWSSELYLVLASRADPPLALARLRASRQLAELRAADLRFTADEAAGLLTQAGAGPEDGLPQSAVAALTGRTEGWAAGLQLAGLSLRGQQDVPGFVAAFTGSNRYILDFLAEDRPGAAAGGRPSACRAGRSRLPARRSGHRAAACDQGHRAVPLVCVHDAAGRRPDHAGLDPAGHGRWHGCAGGDHRGSESCPGALRAGQPSPGATGPAAAGPGRPGRSQPVG